MTTERLSGLVVALQANFLEVEVKNAPTVRYTQDNKTAIAEMDVSFKGLRPDDPPATK